VAVSLNKYAFQKYLGIGFMLCYIVTLIINLDNQTKSISSITISLVYICMLYLYTGLNIYGDIHLLSIMQAVKK